MAFQDKTVCAPCFKKVLDSEEGVQCDGQCDRWFHRTCVGVSKNEYTKIASDKSNKWYCSRIDCKPSQIVPDLNVILSALSQKIDDLSSKVDRLNDLPDNVKIIQEDVRAIHEKFELLEPRIQQLEYRVTDIENTVKCIKSDPVSFEDTLMEINDRNSRLCNLMVYGLAESSSTNVATNREHDKQLISNLVSSVDYEANLDRVKTFRMGIFKKNESRPLKVIFPDEHQAKLFSKRFSERSVEGDSEIKISRDRTVRERNHLRKLRQELEEKINAGEVDLTIRYTNGVPLITKSKPKNA